MDDLELARTIEGRIAGSELDLARTIAERPRATIAPQRPASEKGKNALEALRALGASLDGKLALHETLGEGGMGVVHKATQATMGRHVALKTLRAGVSDVDSTLAILREAWVTGALEHPNIVPVYDVGVDASGLPVIVMKRIEGRHWGELISAPSEIAKSHQARDSLEWNLGILVAVCNATHFAHSRGIIHRDLKPENVMIGAFGEVYVLDWGIAISLRDDPSGRLPPASLATEIAGTPGYMAPEMLLGDPSQLSPRTDVYLLGAIFFEIFAGRSPHEGTTLQAMISSILLSRPKFPRGFPAEARQICERAMSRDPSERYESADAFRRAVEQYARHRGSRKLAHDAKQSLTLLLHTLEHEPKGEERTLAVFNRLGECRFGYRAALAAWPENEAARKGLDRALLAVVEHELADGDPNAASALLREVASPPPELAARIEAAIKKRADDDERLRKLEGDHDPTIGSRTRTGIGAAFGVLWTLSPLLGWYFHEHRGLSASYVWLVVPTAIFLALGSLSYRWARETLSKTLLNRRLAMTLGLHLWGQLLVSTGAWLAGVSPDHATLLIIFTWAATQTFLSIWVERWFALSAAVCAASFLAAAAFPRAIYPIMSLDNFVLTLVLIRVWFPRQDIARLHDTRMELRRRARAWLTETAKPPSDEE